MKFSKTKYYWLVNYYSKPLHKFSFRMSFKNIKLLLTWYLYVFNDGATKDVINRSLLNENFFPMLKPFSFDVKDIWKLSTVS